MAITAGDPGHISAHNNMQDPWTDYSGSMTVGGVTATVTFARFKQIGKTVNFAGGYVLTGVPTAAQTVTLPVTPATNWIGRAPMSMVLFFDASAGTRWQGLGICLSGSTMTFYSTSGNQVGAIAPFSFVATDSVFFSGTYEAA